MESCPETSWPSLWAWLPCTRSPFRTRIGGAGIADTVCTISSQHRVSHFWGLFDLYSPPPSTGCPSGHGAMILPQCTSDTTTMLGCAVMLTIRTSFCCYGLAQDLYYNLPEYRSHSENSLYHIHTIP